MSKARVKKMWPAALPAQAEGWPRRRLLRAGLGLAGSLLLGQTAPARAAGAGDAGQFLQSIGNRAIDLLSDPDIGEEERERRFMDLLVEGFDLPRIARFVIGRYWRRASGTQRDEFLDVFRIVLAQRFSPLFARAKNTQIVIDSIIDDKNDSTTRFVQSSLALASGEVVSATWRISDQEANFQILDVVIEGASMAITLRSEYGGIIKNDGGKLDKLIELLRDRSERNT